MIVLGYINPDDSIGEVEIFYYDEGKQLTRWWVNSFNIHQDGTKIKSFLHSLAEARSVYGNMFGTIILHDDGED